MPAFPSGLIDWLQPGAVGAGFAIVWTEVRGLHRRIDDQGKRIDELREDMKEGFAQSRADNRALNEKLDRLVEASLTAKQSS
ncbi:MAG: hypothetical protein F4Y87_01515 [Synechococcus sp. SB0665_bin_28]|nr:hypothetical protein [Synechococcus sp. SB0665_bin_28]MYF19826.1 hypothetical protein [Synechococcus sp. SB0677_bin_5]MYI87612.1 hypothetical protein [Synechococcus sp. SB0672_bin_10]